MTPAREWYWKESARLLIRQTVQHLASKPVIARPALMDEMLKDTDHPEWQFVPLAMVAKAAPRVFETLLRTVRQLNESPETPPS